MKKHHIIILALIVALTAVICMCFITYTAITTPVTAEYSFTPGSDNAQEYV